jgi:hypothetical protein
LGNLGIDRRISKCTIKKGVKVGTGINWLRTGLFGRLL